MSPPMLSVVVVSFNSQRELPRTLLSLSPQYQVGIDASEYEVIVVDNGSAIPPVASDFAHLGMDLTVLTVPDATPSPVRAVNKGLNTSVGSAIAVFIDGARLASPGLLAAGRDALSVSPRAVVGSRGRYLGHEIQRDAIAKGYNQTVEDALLESSGWVNDGYRLFAISVFDESSGPTWFDNMAESNSLFMRRGMWTALGGYDLAFTSPGGGLVNLDTWRRARLLPGAVPVALLGEATFHQVHGGVATNMPEDATIPMFAEYERLRGQPFQVPPEPLALWGTFKTDPSADDTVPFDEPVHTAWLADGMHRVVARLGPHLPTSMRQKVRSLYKRLAPVVTRTRAAAEAARRAEDADAAALLASGLFDPDWYVANYPDVAAAGYDPVRHYLRFGVAQKRQPGPCFDGLWYANRNLDVRRAGANPLVHYLRFGVSEARAIRVLDPMASWSNSGRT
jgi:hypothetical protein